MYHALLHLCESQLSQTVFHVADCASGMFWNYSCREKFFLTFCLSMTMFLLLCFIWSQKKSLTQTWENLLCFTFKLWLLSASDSASINLCCLREIVSTSLTFRFQQLEYQVFPFKSLFWSCTCSRNKKLVHWKPSPTPSPQPAAFEPFLNAVAHRKRAVEILICQTFKQSAVFLWIFCWKYFPPFLG